MAIEEKEPGLASTLNSNHLRGRLAFIIGAFWTVWTVAYVGGFLYYFDLEIDSIANRVLSVGLITLYVLLLYPPKPNLPVNKLHWYDIIPILVVVIGCGYMLVNAAEFAKNWDDANWYQMILGLSVLAVLLEASRRVIGLSMPIWVLSALFYCVYSNYFPGLLHSTGFSWSRTMGFLYLSKEGLWGVVTEVVVGMVALFIIFGGFLRVTGASRFFADLAFSLTGHVRGGPAKAAVIASMLFGMISGSIAANVATVGQVTIPLMRRIGYDATFSGAIEAAASTGGMFTPPVMGAVAFLIAEYLGMSYWQVCVAAFLPAMIYYGILFFQVDLEAARLSLKGVSKSERVPMSKVLAKGWIYLAPLLLLIVMLGVFQYSATTAILYSTGLLIFVSSFKKESRLTPRRLAAALEDSARGMVGIAPSAAAVGVFVGTLMLTGVTTSLTSNLVILAGNNMVIMLILTGAMAFALGLGMSATAVYLICVLLMAPALIKMGVAPIAAHMFLFYFGCLGFITPPGCIAAFIAAGISGGSPFAVGWRAMRLGAAAYMVPWAFVFYPGILMKGSAMDILISFVICSTGCGAIAIASAGFIWVKVADWQRFLFVVAGCLIFYPYLPTQSIAFAVAVLLILLNKMQARAHLLPLRPQT